MSGQLLFFFGFIVLLSGLTSCSEEEDPYRGDVVYAGSHFKNGKEFMVLSYSKDDAEDRLNNEADAHFYYVKTYTLDLQTGKKVYETKYDVSEHGGDFIGASENYLFYQSSEGVFAIDIFHSGKVITPPQVLKMIGRANPKLNGRIVSITVNSDQLMIVQEQNAEEYLLNTKTLRATPKNADFIIGKAYRMNKTQAKYCPKCFSSTSFERFTLNDTVTLLLSPEQGSAQEKKWIQLSIYSPANKMYGELTPADKTPFLNGNAFGEKDSTVYLSYLTNLGKTGVVNMAAYNWQKHRFLWKKPISSLYAPNESGNYLTAWNSDGSYFLLWGTDVVSLIDAKTGRKMWEF